LKTIGPFSCTPAACDADIRFHMGPVFFTRSLAPAAVWESGFATKNCPSDDRDVEADANVHPRVWESFLDATLERDEHRHQVGKIVCRLVGLHLFDSCA